MQLQQSAAELAAHFWKLPNEGLVDQNVVCAALGKSSAWAERSRWAGTGPRFKKVGRHVRYIKADVLAWLEQQPSVNSTSEHTEAV